MTPDAVLKVADEAVIQAGKELSDLHRTILRESCEGKKYGEMQSHHSYGHIKDAASELWKLLSEALGERVTKSNFQGVLEKRLKSGGIVPQQPMPSSYNQQTWVGRESLISDLLPNLLPKLQGQTRLLWITGISGIGKTALGECLVSKAWEIDPAFQWIYLEVLQGQSPDFPSVAADLLARLGDRDLDHQERNNPDQLARRLLQKLQSHSYWIQLDALERLLKPEHSTEFVDPYWATFLQRCLTEPAFTSRLVLTSQAFPNVLVELDDRYSNVWAEIRLEGLLQVEQQLEFFAKRGIAVDAANQDILARIAKIYEGHPLVLKVIAEDILTESAGDVACYWQVYQPEFEQVARELQTARLDETDYNETLDRKVRDRIKKSLEQLPTDALDLLCRSAVFRRPVPKTFWLAMISDRSSKQQKSAYRTLGDRALIEQEGIHQNQHLIRQHNLIRDIAYNLLRQDSVTWETAERQAAEMWLTDYKPAPKSQTLETVRGYLEACHHVCELEDWESASEIYTKQVGIDQRAFYEQLSIFGGYKELLKVSSKLVDKVTPQTNKICLTQIGSAYGYLGNAKKAIEYHQKALNFSRKIGDRLGEGQSLNNLGVAYKNLSDYQKAIDHYQQALAIFQEMGDRRSEGLILCNLGVVYKNRGCYQQAIDHYKQSLVIAQETGDQRSEGTILGNLGVAYKNLSNYQQAICYHQKRLIIAHEIGHKRGEIEALSNLGLTHDILGDYQQANNFHQQVLKIAREIGDRRGESISLGNLGVTYHNLGNYQQGINFHQQHLTIACEIGDRQGEGRALGNLGEAYAILGDYQKAASYCQQRLAISNEIGDLRGQGIALNNLGSIFTKLKHYAEALEALQDCLRICRDIGERSLEAEVLKNLAELHQKTDKIDQAKEYCDRALALAIELDIPLVKECEELKAQLENEP